MHGAVAAGSEPTARAAEEILKEGGNAVDAAVAACFGMGAGEPALTGLAGGGLMVHREPDGRSLLCDFFSDAPSFDEEVVARRDFYGKDLDFGPVTQRFHIGAGSAAVPGVIPGLCTALENWGSMSLAQVVAPTCRMLREGAQVSALQETVLTILDPIITLTEEGRNLFAPTGRRLEAGEYYYNFKLADTLEALAEGDWRKNYHKLVIEPVLERFGREAGGLITPYDMECYTVKVSSPLESTYRGYTVETGPPPAAGGPMITLMLKLLEREELSAMEPGGAEHVHALCRAMRVADEARLKSLEAHRSDILEAGLLMGDYFDQLKGQPLSAAPELDGGPGCTSHVSVVDAKGGAAAVTMSHGEGGGLFIGDTGIMMNNLMGEEDLFPDGFLKWKPKERLPTMMSPTLLYGDDGTVVVMGTGGANRIRSALVQTITGLVDLGLAPEEAVDFPRVHFEAGVLNAETFHRPGDGAFLKTLGAKELVEFSERNMFFGGVHMVKLGADGKLSGAGDRRRGGVLKVV